MKRKIKDQKSVLTPFALKRLSIKSFLLRQLKQIVFIFVITIMIAVMISLISRTIDFNAMFIGLPVLLLWVLLGLPMEIVLFVLSPSLIEVEDDYFRVHQRSGKCKTIQFDEIIAINRKYRTSTKTGRRWTNIYLIKTAEQKISIDFSFYESHDNLLMRLLTIIEQKNNEKLEEIMQSVAPQLASGEIAAYTKSNAKTYFDPVKDTWKLHLHNYFIKDIAKIELHYRTNDFLPLVSVFFKNGKVKKTTIYTGTSQYQYYEVLFAVAMQYEIPFFYSVRSSRMIL